MTHIALQLDHGSLRQRAVENLYDSLSDSLMGVGSGGLVWGTSFDSSARLITVYLSKQATPATEHSVLKEIARILPKAGYAVKVRD